MMSGSLMTALSRPIGIRCGNLTTSYAMRIGGDDRDRTDDLCSAM